MARRRWNSWGTKRTCLIGQFGLQRLTRRWPLHKEPIWHDHFAPLDQLQKWIFFKQTILHLEHLAVHFHSFLLIKTEYSLGVVTSNRLFSHGKWLILENLFSYANHTNIAYNASNQVWDKKLSFHTMEKLELLFKKFEHKTSLGHSVAFQSWTLP